MKETILSIESKLDKQFENLKIWNKPFQSILTCLFLTAENIAYGGRTDTAMDYISRLSLVYPQIKKLAKDYSITSTSSALLDTKIIEDSKDIIFINAYAHFSMLMPQFHRGTLVASEIKGNKIILDYPDKSTIDAEIIDRIYSYISLHAIVPFPKKKQLNEHTNSKAKSREYTINGKDLRWVKQLFQHYNNYYFNVHVVPNTVFKDSIGVTYQEYYACISTLQAFAEYSISLARSYKEQMKESNSTEDNDKLSSEHMEWTALCISYKSLACISSISGLTLETVYKIISYHLDIISNNTGLELKSNSFCGDGYFPPICLIEESLIFSPHSLMYLLNINNILYSINKINQKLFSQNISPYLEQTLIKQIEYLFSFFKELEVKPNVSYSKSEIDILVLSKTENVMLAIQVKTTIAPDSARTVARVQDRIVEGFEQIEIFESLTKEERLEIVYNEFGWSDPELKIINFIAVRSSAGTTKSWQINNKYRIVNYTFLARLLCEKMKSQNFAIINIDQEIADFQKQLIASSKYKIINQTLEIGDYSIEFPDINYDEKELNTFNLITLECFNDLESAEH